MCTFELQSHSIALLLLGRIHPSGYHALCLALAPSECPDAATGGEGANSIQGEMEMEGAHEDNDGQEGHIINIITGQDGKTPMLREPLKGSSLIV